MKIAESLKITGSSVEIDGEEPPFAILRETIRLEVDPVTLLTTAYLPVVIDGPVTIY